MWPSLIEKAKEGGIDVIQTYVFWNVHEPQPGQVSAVFCRNCKNLKLEWMYVSELLSATVWFQRKIWLGEVHQGSPISRPLCLPQDWTLHREWMDLWVILIFPSFSLPPVDHYYYVTTPYMTSETN